MGYSLSPLPGQSDFGVVVTGFRPEMIDDPEVRRALYDLWIDKGLIVFRDTDGLDTHLKLSEVFGQNEEHPLLRGVDVPQADKVSINIGEEGGGVYEIHGEERGGWLAWHKDSIYTDSLNHGGILWSITVPERGGETGFIDQIAAYDALPEDLKQRIDGLNVIYKYTRDSWESKFGEQPDRRIRLSEFQAQTNMHYTTQSRVIHPMVYTQAETGRKVLNVSPWFADGIEGMENAEGDALLRNIIARITRPERAYFHHVGPGRDGAVGQLADAAQCLWHAGRHEAAYASYDHPRGLCAGAQGGCCGNCRLTGGKHGVRWCAPALARNPA